MSNSKFINNFLRILQKLLPAGIQAKLAIFIGVLIALTILILLAINLQQQNRILLESNEREAAISRKYISSFVLELDNIAQNLIRIEQFRDRVKKQREALRKYQTTRVLNVKKQFSFFGIKTNLFGALGKQKVFQRLNTYYSAYLSEQDIRELEFKTRALLQIPGEPPLSNQGFAGLLYFAGQFVQKNNEILDLRQKITEKEGTPDALKLKASLVKILKEAQSQRFLLDRQITSILSASRKKKILELGLDTKRFRIQTFPLGAIVAGETSTPTFDTNIFDPNSPLNGEFKDPIILQQMEDGLHSLIENSQSKENLLPLEFTVNQMQLQVQYSPHFRNPASNLRSQQLLKLKVSEKFINMGDYLEQDYNISQEISELTKQISERVLILKEKKPPIPPNRDPEFKTLYRKYDGLITGRNTAFDEFVKNKAIGFDPALIDAIGYLRDAALEDMILIYFENSPATYVEYLSSENVRNAEKQRWVSIRRWIYAGESETPPIILKRSITNGMIGYSRSEAEENMWKLDSRPLLSVESPDVADFVNEANFAGVIRTIIDRTSGIKEINANRAQSLLSAFGITTFGIAFAVFLSTIVVKKIKKIIKSAEEVGGGNLNVEFAKGGNDEFGTLTQVLNQMVTGLREREKIKGILGSMVDPVVIGEAMKDLQALKDGTEKKITSFFSDIAGFSTISEKLSSRELAALLNEYLSAMTIILKEHDGVLDKYIGDAIVGIFNAPVEVENYTLKAVQASFRMVEKMHELRFKWIKENKYIPDAREMHFRIGLNTGLAKVGFMGTDALASYTMMGDTVNLASRLEAAAKDYGVTILASQNIYEEVKDSVITRKLDLIRVKGKKEPVTIYELITDKDHRTLSRGHKDSKVIYEEGLALYLQRDWGKAIRTFHESEKIRGREDKAVKMLVERIEYFRKSPPPDNWDGAFTREHK